jgi:hypothetical protein
LPAALDVGLLEEVVGRRRQRGRDADAGRDRDRELLGVGQLERLLERGEDALGDLVGVGGFRSGAVEHDHELIAAEAADRVAAAQHAAQARADLAQHLVAAVVSKPVVDLLEAVDVHEQRCHGDVEAARAREHLLGAVEHERTVRQAGQRIVERAELELLGLLADEAPGALAREREHAVEQEHQECDEHADRKDDQRLRARGDGAGSGAGDLDEPAAGDLGAAELTGRAPGRVGADAPDEHQRAARVAVVEGDGDRALRGGQHRAQQCRAVEGRGDEAGHGRSALRDGRDRRAGAVDGRANGDGRAGGGAARHRADDERAGVGHGVDQARVGRAAEARELGVAVVQADRVDAAALGGADDGARKAVDGAAAGWDHRVAAARKPRERRVGELAALERRQPCGGDRLDQDRVDAAGRAARALEDLPVPAQVAALPGSRLHRGDRAHRARDGDRRVELRIDGVGELRGGELERATVALGQRRAPLVCDQRRGGDPHHRDHRSDRHAARAARQARTQPPRSRRRPLRVDAGLRLHRLRLRDCPGRLRLGRSGRDLSCDGCTPSLTQVSPAEAGALRRG